MRIIPLLLLLLLPGQDDELQQAKKDFAAGRYQDAVKKLQVVHKKDPDSIETYQLLVLSHEKLKEYGKAVETLKAALDRGHDPFKIRMLGNAAANMINDVFSKKDPKDKKALFEPFLATFDKQMPQRWKPAIRSQLLLAYAKLGESEKAAALEEQVLGKSPTHSDYLSVGTAYVGAEFRVRSAMEYLEKGIELLKKSDPGKTDKEKEIHRTTLMTYRSYLAFAYHLNGKTDNPIASEDGEPNTKFVDASERVGLSEAEGSRFAVVDFDNDGWDDLISQGQLWRNNEGRFEKSTALPKVPGNGWLFGDLDNDGRPDLVVFRREGLRVFRNSDKGFVEETKKSTFEKLPANPEGNALVDVDEDGDLDIYVATYESGGRSLGNEDHLYINNGDFTFQEEAEKRGLRLEKLCGRGVNAADFDNDGDQDIFVSNYRLNPNYLWLNDGKGMFKNIAKERGVEGVKQSGRYYGHTIGSCWGDLDNDGDLDLISANLAHPRFIDFSDKTMVFRNLGAEGGWKFENIFDETGIEYEETHSDVSMTDIDNDGDLDVFFTSVYKERPNFLYQNEGGWKFRKITWKAGVISFNGWGHAWLDFDNDGDMDFVVRRNGKMQLFENKLGKHNSWLQVRLKGKKSGIGARVTVKTGGRTLIREVSGGRGTTSQDSLVQHFGLGGHKGKVDLEIRWGRGMVQRVSGVEINRRVTIEQP